MTAYQPYQAYPGPAPVQAAPPPILVAAAGPAPQQRATVLVRAILTVPHLVLLYVLNLAANLVLFIGWWGALFTGRLPEFAYTFLSGVLRWTTRVYAYYFMLTDVYPPFSFDDDPTYPVRVAVPARQQLNRAAVFFRFILMIPAAFLGSILFYGAGTIMAFVAWLITLVNGQLPAGFYLAYTSVLRYSMRLLGYYWMLTAAYPSGLFGDKPGAVAWADALPAGAVPGFPPPGFAPQAPGFGGPAAGFGAQPAGFGPQGPGAAAQPGYEPTQTYRTPQASPEPPAQQPFGAPQQQFGAPQPPPAPQPYGAAPGWGAPQGYQAPQPYGTPGYGAPSAYGAPGYPPAYGAPGYGARPVFQPATWLLPLTSGARRLVVTFIVIGALIVPGSIALDAVRLARGIGSITSGTAYAQLELTTSHITLTTALGSDQQREDDCLGHLSCLTGVSGDEAEAYSDFSSDVSDLSMPADAMAAENRLDTATQTLIDDYSKLAAATGLAQWHGFRDDQLGLQQATNEFDSAYQALLTQLDTDS